MAGPRVGRAGALTRRLERRERRLARSMATDKLPPAVPAGREGGVRREEGGVRSEERGARSKE